MRYRTLTAGAWGLLWITVIPMLVRNLRVEPERWRPLLEDFPWEPLTLFLLAALLFFLVRAYRDLMGWEGALEESRLRKQGLYRFALAADSNVLVARAPNWIWRGDRCLLVPRRTLVAVRTYWHGKNPQEPSERFLRFSCQTEEGGQRDLLLPYALEVEFDRAASLLDSWARGHDLEASPSSISPQSSVASRLPSSGHRFPLIWSATILGLSALAWTWPL